MHSNTAAAWRVWRYPTALRASESGHSPTAAAWRAWRYPTALRASAIVHSPAAAAWRVWRLATESQASTTLFPDVSASKASLYPKATAHILRRMGCFSTRIRPNWLPILRERPTLLTLSPTVSPKSKSGHSVTAVTSQMWQFQTASPKSAMAHSGAAAAWRA